jgi:hypothetical protein
LQCAEKITLEDLLVVGPLGAHELRASVTATDDFVSQKK